MFTLPAVLPARYVSSPTAAVVSDVDTGGYDFLIGGHGFRLASDTQNPYRRYSEATTVRRFDSSPEVGEQTLAELPWPRSQSSFHGGAGQLNLEQGYSEYQYQQEEVAHVRYDTSLGVDPWTVGQVSRLPDCRFSQIPTGAAPSVSTSASSGGVDFVVVGTEGQGLWQAAFSSGPDAAASWGQVDLTALGSDANCTVASLTNDGAKWYALVHLGSPVGSNYTYIISGQLGDTTTAPSLLYKTGTTELVPGALGWVKFRLMGGLGSSLYELDSAGGASLPDPKYTHPAPAWTWVSISESPTGVLAAGDSDQNRSAILAMTLDTSGAVPTLTGGTVVGTLPAGEHVLTMNAMLGSFLAVGTSRGVRICTFGSGPLNIGPLSLETTSPVEALATRDRFAYASYSDQQADGSTGLAAIDLSFFVDAAGRNAWAPSLRPKPGDPQTGTVVGAHVLPQSNRLAWVTASGLYVEGGSAGSSGDAWLRTSRIRYDTAEPKLWVSGRLHGQLQSGNIKVTGIAPYGESVYLGTFGFILDTDDSKVEFGLQDELHEWIQLQFGLEGSESVLNTYQVKALPAPTRQHIILLSANCFTNETDRFNLEVTDPETPRQRWQNIVDLESSGRAARLVEFTNAGSVAQLVFIDQVDFTEVNRPTIDSDFGGIITFKLRVVE